MPLAATPPAAERKKSGASESRTQTGFSHSSSAVNLLSFHPVELSLVVPAYNERDNLAPLLAEIAAALAVPTATR